jgi:hypothetical protein
MALVISSVQVTGTATAYTVPAGKVAKVRLVALNSFGNFKKVFIGNYIAENVTGASLTTYKQGKGAGATSNTFGPPVTGFVRVALAGDAMDSSFIYIKEDHVLVAGETVSCDDSGTLASYTIFQEDV